MRRKYIVISVILICVFILAFFISFKIRNESKNVKELSDSGVLLKEVNAETDKVSFDAEILVTETFDECMHYDEYNIKLDDRVINLNEEEVKKYFEEKGYDIRNFNSKKIELLKNNEGICENHYVIKSDNDSDVFLNIYKKDEEGELEFYKQTDIAKEFLTDMDKELFESGVEVLGIENIEKVLEDYE